MYRKRASIANDEGVSPVIAIILMVAITVVLAGVLYVWVQSLVRTDPMPEPLNLDGRIAIPDNGTAVLSLDHNGGESIDWSDYRVRLNDTELQPGQPETIVGETATFAYPQAPLRALAAGATYTVLVIETEYNRIVWDRDITARDA